MEEGGDEKKKKVEMELSITAGAPQEVSYSQPIDRFSFERLSHHTHIHACMGVCVCMRMYCIVLCSSQVAGANTKPGPLKDKAALKPNPAFVNQFPLLLTQAHNR